MARSILQLGAALLVTTYLVAAPAYAADKSAAKKAADPKAKPDLGVEIEELSPVVDNPYVALASVKRKVFEGIELEDGKKIKVRTEAHISDTPEAVAGMKVTTVEVSDFDAGELVEKTKDYYAQHKSGVVYYVGEHVDDIEAGKVTGHGGQWIAGEKGAKLGIYMPAEPQVGDVFEQEKTPGVAEDRSKVLAKHDKVTLPAGTFEDCIEVEDYDPIGKTTQRKMYCRGVGLVQEIFKDGSSIDLIEIEKR